MSRCAGRHAKVTSRYSGRHARPAPPGAAAAVIGTAARAVPASLVLGAAGSAFALSGTASAATTGPATATAAPAAVAAPRALTAPRTLAARAHEAAGHRTYRVVSGDTLSGISARFCGTPGDYPALAAASGIASPDLIYAGQAVTLACHHTATTAAVRSSRGDGDGDGDDGSAAPAASRPATPAASTSYQAPAQPARPRAATVSTAGTSAFEACVIAHESGGNPQAVNAASGAGGLYQFLPSTWASLGYAGAYPGGAQTAPVSVQKAAFARLYAQAGAAPWRPYDGC